MEPTGQAMLEPISVHGGLVFAAPQARWFSLTRQFKASQRNKGPISAIIGISPATVSVSWSSVSVAVSMEARCRGINAENQKGVPRDT